MKKLLMCLAALVCVAAAADYPIAMPRMGSVKPTGGTNGVAAASIDSRIAAGFTVLNGSAEAPCSFGFADAANGDFRFVPGAAILKVCPGFQLLPLERIAGPRDL